MTAKWVSVEDQLPPDHWFGLVLVDVRPDMPVMAHTANGRYRSNFPYANYFIGRWREAILIGDHLRDKAHVIYWLKDFSYPEVPGYNKNA